MDQVKIGSFLKKLRKEKNLTQEQLAEQLGVSNRTISRWETASNMPDIVMLVEIADFYDVSIPEIIEGERKSETMNQEAKETAIKMAEYGKSEVKLGQRKVVSIMLMAFGVFVIIAALSTFPNDSSWGSIYSIIGSVFLIVGIFLVTKWVWKEMHKRIIVVAGCAAILFGLFSVSDYVAVTQFNRVPRFSYLKSYSSDNSDEIEHKTLFFTAVQKHPGTKDERVEIVKK